MDMFKTLCTLLYFRFYLRLIKREAIVKQEVFVNKKLYPCRCDAIILLTVNLAEELPKWSRKCLLKGSGLAKEGRGTWMPLEHTSWRWSLENYEAGSEGEIDDTVRHVNQLLTLFPPSLGNWEVSSVSKSFGRRSLAAQMSLNQSQGDELRFWTTVSRCLWEQLTQDCSQGFQHFAGFPTECFPSTLEGRGVWRTSSRWGWRSGWDPRTLRRRSNNTFC